MQKPFYFILFYFISVSCRDVGEIVEAVYGDNQPTCVLVGHSMGGAIAVHASHDLHVAGK